MVSGHNRPTIQKPSFRANNTNTERLKSFLRIDWRDRFYYAFDMIAHQRMIDYGFGNNNSKPFNGANCVDNITYSQQGF